MYILHDKIICITTESDNENYSIAALRKSI